uniref:Uncharacterized protein n=1 Tax=Cacopsylla melanoneura TaxID=428564 RepID=A0A8D8YWQ8_9HEMI
MITLKLSLNVSLQVPLLLISQILMMILLLLPTNPTSLTFPNLKLASLSHLSCLMRYWTFRDFQGLRSFFLVNRLNPPMRLSLRSLLMLPSKHISPLPTCSSMASSGMLTLTSQMKIF